MANWGGHSAVSNRTHPKAYRIWSCADSLCRVTKQTLRGLHYPLAVALLGDGTAWVIESDVESLVQIGLADGERLIGVERPDFLCPQDLALVGDSLLVLGWNVAPPGRCV